MLFVIVKGTVSVNSSASKCKDSQQCLIETIINNVEKIVKIDNSWSDKSFQDTIVNRA